MCKGNNLLCQSDILGKSSLAAGQGKSRMMNLGSGIHQLCQGSGLAATFTQGSVGLSAVHLKASGSQHFVVVASIVAFAVLHFFRGSAVFSNCHYLGIVASDILHFFMVIVMEAFKTFPIFLLQA